MTQRDYTEKLKTIERLLNDPDLTMGPDLIWSLWQTSPGQIAPFQAPWLSG